MATFVGKRSGWQAQAELQQHWQSTGLRVSTQFGGPRLRLGTALYGSAIESESFFLLRGGLRGGCGAVGRVLPTVAPEDPRAGAGFQLRAACQRPAEGRVRSSSE